MNKFALELFLEGFKIRGKTALTGFYVGFGDGNFFLELYFNLKRTVHVFPVFPGTLNLSFFYQNVQSSNTVTHCSYINN